MRGALEFGLLECVTFFLATLNFRACAKNRMFLTLVTDMLIAASGFVLVRMVATATRPAQMAGYVVGAGCGSLSGMWITRRWG